MKLFCAILLFSSLSNAADCDRHIYDQMYMAVVKANLDLDIERLHRMNEHFQKQVEFVEPERASFDLLRRLCHNQLTSYERKNK